MNRATIQSERPLDGSITDPEIEWSDRHFVQTPLSHLMTDLEFEWSNDHSNSGPVFKP